MHFRTCMRSVGFEPTTYRFTSAALPIELDTCQDVRVRWLRCHLDNPMPHAQCASPAGSHGFQGFRIRLYRYLSIPIGPDLSPLICHSALGDKPRTKRLPFFPDCRCLACVQSSALPLVEPTALPSASVCTPSSSLAHPDRFRPDKLSGMGLHD